MPIPTFLPGCHFVPHWRAMTLPGSTGLAAVLLDAAALRVGVPAVAAWSPDPFSVCHRCGPSRIGPRPRTPAVRGTRTNRDGDCGGRPARRQPRAASRLQFSPNPSVASAAGSSGRGSASPSSPASAPDVADAVGIRGLVREVLPLRHAGRQRLLPAGVDADAELLLPLVDLVARPPELHDPRPAGHDLLAVRPLLQPVAVAEPVQQHGELVRPSGRCRSRWPPRTPPPDRGRRPGRRGPAGRPAASTDVFSSTSSNGPRSSRRAISGNTAGRTTSRYCFADPSSPISTSFRHERPLAPAGRSRTFWGTAEVSRSRALQRPVRGPPDEIPDQFAADLTGLRVLDRQPDQPHRLEVDLHHPQVRLGGGLPAAGDGGQRLVEPAGHRGLGRGRRHAGHREGRGRQQPRQRRGGGKGGAGHRRPSCGSPGHITISAAGSAGQRPPAAGRHVPDGLRPPPRTTPATRAGGDAGGPGVRQNSTCKLPRS